MAVRAEDIEAIQESLPLVRQHYKPLSMAFYDNLFAIAPEMRPLFRDDIASQGMRFISTLATIADVLGDPEALDTELSDLAGAHKRLGVEKAHFASMGSALMVTLGETLGERFTPRLQGAWRAAYDHIADEMIRRGAFV